jgi:hypothetical protein
MKLRSFSRPIASAAALAIVLGAGCACSHKEKTDAVAAASAANTRAPDPSSSFPRGDVPSSSRPSGGAGDGPSAAAFPVGSAAVAFVVNPQGLPPYDGPTGSVEGTVYVVGPPAPNVAVDTSACPAALDTYGKLFREGPPLSNGARPLADAATVVVGYSGAYLPERSEAKRLEIGSNCAYPARTLTLTYGQRLEISNKSKLLFAPIISQDMSTAVMVAPPEEKGDPVKLYPRQAGRFALTDRMQPFVREDLYVLRHPLHTVTDRDGHYRLDGLPVGSLKVGVHHPAIEADAEAPVEVIANVVQKVDLTLTYTPKPPAKRSPAPRPVRPPNE